jgi:hypothetical protein
MRSAGGTNFGRAEFRYLLDKDDDGLFGLAIVPRRQRISSAGDGSGEDQHANQCGGEDVLCACCFIIIFFLPSLVCSLQFLDIRERPAFIKAGNGRDIEAALLEPELVQ